jgi:hypothetical protein
MLKKYPLFFAVIMYCLFSCVSAPVERSVPGKIRLDQFETPGAFDWRNVLGEDGPVEGLDLFTGIFSGPALELWALRVDLANPRLRVLVGPAPEGGVVRALKVSSFAREYGCTAAINANPFEIPGKKGLAGLFTGREGEAQTAVGLEVSQGVVTSPPNPRYDALAFYAGGPALAGRAAVISQAEAFSGSGPIENAVGGFYRILEDGKPSAQALSERGSVRHPRSAAGISADGRFLYLLVIDGRRPGSAGATEAETAFILERLGAADALCFDGGGSSALVLRQGREGVKVLNTPVHGRFPGRERAVAVCLGIVIRPADASGGRFTS